MGEVKDPKMKLFGTTIELPETVESGEPSGEGNSVAEDGDFSADAEDRELNKDLSHSKNDGARTEDRLEESNAPCPVSEDSKVADPNVGAAKTLKTEEEHIEPQEKTLKKPDKILPCPRCNSTDTKFCYFNNYNVNQPRHFCKNCQRYWTAGGTMRNVPVGAGRRRNKAQFRQQTPPAEPSRVDFPNPIHPNNSTLCESMVSVLNIADQMIRPNPGEVSLSGSIENGNDCATSKEKLVNNETPPEMIPNCPTVPYFPGASWPYTWQSVQWSAPVLPTSFVPGGFPLPFYSTAPPFWNVPWMIPTTLGSGPNSPTLGKHSRDDENEDSPNLDNKDTQKDSNPEKCLWVPKTLRIDDPGEAAKSSIWATLGIVKNNDKGDGIGGSNLFKALQSRSKGNDESAKVQVPEASSAVLQANPAALSRSLSFHESL